MDYKTDLLHRIEAHWVLARRRSEDYPEGSPDQQMYEWMAEDYGRLQDIVRAYRPTDVNLPYELYKLLDDTPFAPIQHEIRTYLKYSDIMRTADEKHRGTIHS